ncbi:MAG: exopolysaccharide biosynthesis polyprenyl glycosylphosphotransferase [Clostridia bacterium]|nr:exopolysaccharide biosynthesis polyprenyl glycosylphosphotransferase [Clostridia bacterium]
MNKLTKAWKRHKTAIMTGLLRLFIYVVLAALFFGFMAINNWQIRHLSRTLATMLLTYAAMMVAMHAVYGGYAVGKKKSKPIISSMSLATLATDLVTYVQLQIMNVNEELNHKLLLFGSDFMWLLVCMLLQVVLIIFWVRLGNNFYFTINPPKRCLVILGNLEEKVPLCRKIGIYKLQWKVQRVMMWNDPRVQSAIHQTEQVFLGSLPTQAKLDILRICYEQHRDVICKAQLQDIMLSNATQIVVDDTPFLEMAYGKMTLGQRIAKRLMDIVVSALVLLVLLPVLAVIAICIKLEDGGPVLFRQKRMTVAGNEFVINKFRTMKVEEQPDHPQVSASREDDRITRVGQVLRRFRLDELPQFWNILLGDMTLVGPRPEMLENVEKYKLELPAFAYREKMKAGLTGYAQIEGRYNTTPEDKLMLDLMYIESFSIWMDIKLLFRTMTVFFKRDSTEGFDTKNIQDDTKKPPLGA